MWQKSGEDDGLGVCHMLHTTQAQVLSKEKVETESKKLLTCHRIWSCSVDVVVPHPIFITLDFNICELQYKKKREPESAFSYIVIANTMMSVYKDVKL